MKTPTRQNKPATLCPCGSSSPYGDCCGRWHGGVPAPDPESLMRSRYTAYVLGLAEYLLATWHATSRPAELDLATPPQPKWLGLEIRQRQIEDANHGVVEFVARYKIGGRAQRLHETSRFVREDGQWYYVDGRISE